MTGFRSAPVSTCNEAAAPARPNSATSKFRNLSILTIGRMGLFRILPGPRSQKDVSLILMR